MHSLFFPFKRVHQRCLTRPRLAASGCRLTPARFDLMRVLLRWGTEGVPQGKLAELLGVTAGEPDQPDQPDNPERASRELEVETSPPHRRIGLLHGVTQ